MKLYFFSYTDKGGEFYLEVFPSESKARKRLSDLRKEDKQLTAAWGQYLSRKELPRPKVRLNLPSGIRELDIDLTGKAAVIQAFIRGVQIGRVK